MIDEEEVHNNKSPTKTYVTSAFVVPQNGARKRVVSKVFDSSIGFDEAQQKGEAVLQVTHGGRREVIAKIYEADRDVTVLTIKRYNGKKPSGEAHFSFVGSQITKLMEFLTSLRTLPMKSDGAFSVSDSDLRRHNLTLDEARKLVQSNPELIAQVV